MMKKIVAGLAVLIGLAMACGVPQAMAFSGENQAFSAYQTLDQLSDWTVNGADLHNGQLRLRWDKAFAQRSFSPVGGRVVWEVEFRPLHANGSQVAVELFGGGALAASMQVSSTLAVSFGGVPAGVSMAANQTYTLRVVLDMDGGYADYYLTGGGLPADAGMKSDWSNSCVAAGLPLQSAGVQSADQMRVSISGAYEAAIGRVSLAEIPRVPAEHPRLYVNRGDVSNLRGKVKKAPDLYAEVNASCAKTVADCTNNGTGLVYEVGYNYLLRKDIENIAFSYLMTNDAATGQKAIAMAKVFLDKTQFQSSYSQTYFLSDTIHMAAVVYDWCYDQFASDTARQEYLAILRRRMAEMEIKHPVTGPSSITSHASGAQFLRTILGVGVAVYDECPEVYDISASRIIAQYVPARNFFSKSGFSNMGTDYGSARYAADMYANHIFRAIGYDNVLNETNRLPAYTALYARKPDGTLLHDGDMYSDRYSKKGDYWMHPLSMGLAAGYYHDPFLTGEFMKQWQQHSDSDPETSAALSLVLFPFGEEAAAAALPLTKYHASPNASVIARTSWEDDAAVAYMKIGGYQLNNHQHLDAGQFQLYYKGALAVDSGLYEWDGGGGYYTAHDVNYHKRTIAHNALLIRDETQQYANFNAGYPEGNISNDGGQLFAARGTEPGSLEEIFVQDRKTSDVKAHAFGPDRTNPAYSYIKGDLTNAYDTSRVTNYQRAMFFLNFGEDDRPGALFVFDRAVSADANYDKYWLLHTMNQPTVRGNTFTTVNGGKLTGTTVYPEAPVIETVGGKDHKFDVFGVNYDEGGSISLSAQRPYEEGNWRVQVSPSSPAQEDVFLHVLEMTDANTVASDAARIAGNGVVGALVHGNAVLFSRSGEKLQSAVTFPLSAPAMCYVTDLEAGAWKAYADGVYVTTVSVTAEGGVGAVALPAAAEVRLQREGTEPLRAPQQLQTAAITQTGAYLLWDEANGVHPVYEVYANGSLIGTTEDTEYLLNGLAPGTAYTIAVRAVCGGEAAQSETLHITTTKEGKVYFDMAGDQLIVDWETLPGDAGYDLMIDNRYYANVTPPFTPPQADGVSAFCEHKVYLKRKPGDFSEAIYYANFYDDFADGTLGLWEPRVYQNADGTPRGTAEFGLSPDGKHCFVMTDTDDDPTDSYRNAVRLLRGFHNMTGKFMLETKWMLEQAEVYATSGLGIGIFGTANGKSRQAVRLNVFSDGTLGGYRGYNADATQFRIPGNEGAPPLAEHTWVTLRLFFDVERQSFDLVVQSDLYKGWNGTALSGASFDRDKGLFVWKDIPFYTETTDSNGARDVFTCLNAIDFMQQRYQGRYYIDYVKLVELPEAGGELQSYGYACDTGSGSVRVYGENFDSTPAGPFVVTAAAYRDGELIGAAMQRVALDSGEAAVYPMDLPGEPEQMKVFFWRADSLSPLRANRWFSGMESR